MSRLPVAATLLLGALVICSPVEGASPTEQLRGFFGAAARILDPGTAEPPEARLGAIRSIVKEIVDVRAAAQLSLGPSWSARSAAELDEFVTLFADLLERALIGGIAGKIRLPDGIQVRYVGESVDGSVATVWTTIASRSGLDLPFTYRMIERAGRWAIRDVVIDGVSVAANYRAQFIRVMQSSSYQELVRQMRARVPEMPAVPLVAAATSDDAPMATASPAPDPPSPEARTGGRSAAHLKLDLEVTLLARALPEAAPTPADGDKAVAGERAEPVASRRDQARREPDPPRATAAPSAPAPEAPSGPTGAAYWVQIGAFKSPEAARRLTALLAEAEPSASSRPAPIVESWAADILLTRVRVGPFPHRWEAAAKAREMEARGYKPFIAVERE